MGSVQAGFLGDLTATPIPGGWHIKMLGDGRCVDVLKLLYNFRVVLSTPDHVLYEGGWCYFGHGIGPNGSPRTMETAKAAALLAAHAWDGQGEPSGFDKPLKPPR